MRDINLDVLKNHIIHILELEQTHALEDLVCCMNEDIHSDHIEKIKIQKIDNIHFHIIIPENAYLSEKKDEIIATSLSKLILEMGFNLLNNEIEKTSNFLWNNLPFNHTIETCCEELDEKEKELQLFFLDIANSWFYQEFFWLYILKHLKLQALINESFLFDF